MTSLKTPKTNTVIFYLSVASSIFLLSMYLNNTVFKFDAAIIGVLLQLLSLPAMVLQPFLMINAGIAFDRSIYKIKSYPFYTILISTVTFLLITYSFS